MFTKYIANWLASLSVFSHIITTTFLHNNELLSSLVATHELVHKLSTAVLKGTTGKITSLAFDAISSPDTQHIAHGIITAGGKFITVSQSSVDHKNGGKLLHHVRSKFYAPPNHELCKIFLPVLMQWLSSDETIKVCRSFMHCYSMFTVEIDPGGLNDVSFGLQRLKNNLVSAQTLVIHPREARG